MTSLLHWKSSSFDSTAPVTSSFTLKVLLWQKEVDERGNSWSRHRCQMGNLFIHSGPTTNVVRYIFQQYRTRHAFLYWRQVVCVCVRVAWRVSSCLPDFLANLNSKEEWDISQFHLSWTLTKCEWASLHCGFVCGTLPFRECVCVALRHSRCLLFWFGGLTCLASVQVTVTWHSSPCSSESEWIHMIFRRFFCQYSAALTLAHTLRLQ